MKRYFYLSDDLDDLEAIQKELEERDITEPQIHVLSEQDQNRRRGGCFIGRRRPGHCLLDGLV